jgi:hypothetical protein
VIILFEVLAMTSDEKMLVFAAICRTRLAGAH